MNKLTSNELRNLHPSELRGLVRDNSFAIQTGGSYRGFVQTNIVILPAEYAQDFKRYCQLNPKPCPLLATGEPGNPKLPELGSDIDIRTDVPAFNIFEGGELVNTVFDIKEYWQDDFVTFALGCSYSFEEALEDVGLEVRHNRLGLVSPMYTTNIETKSVGPFFGPTVVTMRPFSSSDVDRVIQVTSRFPKVHGAPIHIGNPNEIGIEDLAKTEFGGNAVPVNDNEVPVFWACGVTPQLAVANAQLPICITHKPAFMLVTDRTNAEFTL